MSGSLDDLGGIFAKHDLKNELETEKEVAERIDRVYAELRNQLGNNNPELDESEQEQVKTAFEQVVRDDIEDILTNEAGVEEFSEQVKSTVEDLEDILRSPQAEAVVDTILTWLLSTGLEPLSDDKQVELREIVKEDLEAAKQAVRDARSAHDSLRGYLGEAQQDIDQMILEEIENTSSISDLESLAEGLERLDDAWTGNWKLNYETEAGENLYQELLEKLEGNLAEEVASQNNINSLAAILENKSGRWERNLDKIEESWSKIETRVEQIDPPDGSFAAADALELSQKGHGPSLTLSSYQTTLKNTAELLTELRDVSQTNIDRYRPPESPKPDIFADEIASIADEVAKAETTREEAFAAEKKSDIDDKIENFDDTVEELDEMFSDLQEAVNTEIKTTRKLATKFDLEEQQSELNDLYSRANSADSTTSLMEVFADYETTAAKVREPVQNQLSEGEEQIFTFMIETGSTGGDSDGSWNSVIENIDQERQKLLKNIASLERKGLLEISIQVA